MRRVAPGKSWKRTSFAIIFLLLVLSVLDATTIFQVGGLNWDFIAEMLYAKALVNPAFYSALLSGNLASSISYGNAFYFEMLRPPVTGLVMAPFALIGNLFVPVYTIFILAFLTCAALYLAKHMKVQPLLMALLFLTPYVVFYFLALNGAEIVSMAFLLIAVALLLQKRAGSGTVLALAGMAKYPSMVFLPLLLLLPRGTRRKAFIYYILTTLPWLAFNTIVFGNPLYSYAVSIGSFHKDAQGLFSTYVISESLKLILPSLLPALAIAVLLAAIWALRSKRKRVEAVLRRLRIMDLGYREKTVLCLFAMAWVGWLATAVSGSMNDLPREGYLIYTGMALVLAVVIATLSKLKLRLPLTDRPYAYAVAFLSFATMAMLVAAYFSIFSSYPFGTHSTTNPLYKNVTEALSQQGIINCNVISNNWVYLIYMGIRAHHPYYYNATVQGYPIVYFTSPGANNTAVNMANVTSRFNYTGFIIAYPKNWTC